MRNRGQPDGEVATRLLMGLRVVDHSITFKFSCFPFTGNCKKLFLNFRDMLSTHRPLSCHGFASHSNFKDLMHTIFLF